jgi:proline racemase
MKLILPSSDTFDNVPTFALHRDSEIELPGLGRLSADEAKGRIIYSA